MKILRISGANLASLGEPFEVDFESEPLASAGLFGISGPTGAGKSTLLDALCLALYDATPRLAKANRATGALPDVGDDTVSAYDPRTLLRRGAAEGHAEVDFVGNDNQRYRARWSVRRARAKATGSLQKSSLSLQRLPDLVPIGGTKTEVAAEIASRIGLSFEQFTRAVLLAQNEFSAFLKTDENERGELLETLTGSDVYSSLSRRAFERHKTEQAKVQQLVARLADNVPLEAPQRAALESQLQEAGAALARAQSAREASECQWRWFEEERKLAGHAAEAANAVEQAHGARVQAEPRRRRLATIDAAQAARPLAADVARLDKAQAALDAAVTGAAASLAAAQAGAHAAREAQVQAQAHMAQAEQAQRDAAPLLDAAKALDARIAALAPGHESAKQARDLAAAQAEAAKAALTASIQEREFAADALAQLARWLDSNRHAETLAVQWPRWEKLLDKAALLSGEVQALALAGQRANSVAEQAREQERQATAALGAATERLALLGGERQRHEAAAAAFDVDAMRRERQQIDARRLDIAHGEKRWNELASATAALEQARAKRSVAMGVLDDATARQGGANAAAGSLSAALAQAQASYEAAQAACGDNVEHLRGLLLDGDPCPVCGSEAHPYHKQDDKLRAMLASLGQQVERCRAGVQDNVALQASLAATMNHASAEIATLDGQLALLEPARDKARLAWESDPLSTQPGIDDTWFARERQALELQASALGQREEQAASTHAAREQARKEHELAQAELARLQAAATTAATAAAAAIAAHQGAAEKHALAQSNLEAVLAELDPAMPSDGWRAGWQRDPAVFAGDCRQRAGEWNERIARQARLSTDASALDAKVAAATAHNEAIAAARVTAQQAFDLADASIASLRRERTSLLDGRATADVESSLATRVAQSRSKMEQAQLDNQRATQDEVRALEAHGQAVQRSQANRTEHGAAQQALLHWLAGFAAAHPALDPVDDAGALGALLAHDAGWIAAERDALARIDTAVAAAETVMAERRARIDAHAAVRPEGAGTAESVQAALQQAVAQFDECNSAVLSLRLQLAQDDARRGSSAAMLAELDAQREVERRWARMSELIGSSDGKKFRNYAQQFTLDVLLGYANRHLDVLAKRYRLERVASAGGPSLGLLVRDQDMGGEARSVNSLSGGESFLVSLALALGLASLSSNRVRVESLFIDEGFGSLDSETLRVAMDALDALQSMGRKVGVISHVQEMADRIAARIVVTPAGAGLSTISVP